MDHQDHLIINIGNPNLQKNHQLGKQIVKKTNVDLHKIKIENEQENFEIKKIPKSLSQQIINARNLQKITQKDMAVKINVQRNTYNDIESGKAQYDSSTKQIVQKLQKTMGIIFKK